MEMFGAGVPLGGDTGQVLTKNSGVSFDTIWASPRIYNPNILDNWYFMNPINQQGKTSYSGNNVYGIDRWYCGHPQASMTVEDDGLKVSYSNDTGHIDSYYTVIRQKVSVNLSQQTTVTLSFLITEIQGNDFAIYLTSGGNNYIDKHITTPGLYSVTLTIPSTTKSIDVAIISLGQYQEEIGDYCKLLCAKLELGTQQSLAYQNSSGNWVLLDPP